MRTISQKGEGRGSLIFGLLVLFTALYIAWKVIPVMIDVYSFEDKVNELCKFFQRQTVQELKDDIIEEAKLKNLPVNEENVSAEIIQLSNYRVLQVSVHYVVPISTPVYVYNWEQDIDYEAPVFN